MEGSLLESGPSSNRTGAIISPPWGAWIRNAKKFFHERLQPRAADAAPEAAGTSGNSGLLAVIAFDDQYVGIGVRTADRDQPGVFRRIVAGERSLIILEFQ